MLNVKHVLIILTNSHEFLSETSCFLFPNLSFHLTRKRVFYVFFLLKDTLLCLKKLDLYVRGKYLDRKYV